MRAVLLTAIVLALAVPAESVVLCAKQRSDGTFSSTVKIRETCAGREVALDPVALGLQGPKGDPGEPAPTSCSTTYTDNGDGTVTDTCTGLVWEQKRNFDHVVNYSDPHDADNTYSWASGDYDPDGTAFTDFLAKLNTPPCLAGQCDWRLPNSLELRGLLLEPYPPCTAAWPCIAPELGPTLATDYWSSTTVAYSPGNAWAIGFDSGEAKPAGKLDDAHYRVRAVRNPTP